MIFALQIIRGSNCIFDVYAGSEEERAAVRTANLMSERPGLYDSGPEVGDSR